jgi:hypothetical protein
MTAVTSAAAVMSFPIEDRTDAIILQIRTPSGCRLSDGWSARRLPLETLGTRQRLSS